MIVALVVVVLIVALVGETPQMRNRRLGVPRVPLEVFQDEVRTKVASRSLVGTSTSVPLSASSSEGEIVYCCPVGIPSRTDGKKLNSLKSWYQIPDDLTLIWLSVVNGAVILILG